MQVLPLVYNSDKYQDNTNSERRQIAFPTLPGGMSKSLQLCRLKSPKGFRHLTREIKNTKDTRERRDYGVFLCPRRYSTVFLLKNRFFQSSLAGIDIYFGVLLSIWEQTRKKRRAGRAGGGGPGSAAHRRRAAGRNAARRVQAADAGGHGGRSDCSGGGADGGGGQTA